MRTLEKKPPLLTAAYFFLCLGTIGTICSLWFMNTPEFFKGLLFISVSLIGFGTGEVINHPKLRPSEAAGDTANSTPFYRKRNACGLGNLLDIASLLIFFAGMSALIY